MTKTACWALTYQQSFKKNWISLYELPGTLLTKAIDWFASPTNAASVVIGEKIKIGDKVALASECSLFQAVTGSSSSHGVWSF